MLKDINSAKYGVFCHPDESCISFLGRISAYNEILRERIIGDFLRKTTFFHFAESFNKR
jgi:hypothetical protein